MLLTIAFTFSAIISLICYFTNRYLFSHWRRHGISQGKPTFLFGDFKDILLHTKSFADGIKEIYVKNKQHKIFGVYLLYKPMIVVNDPKLIRDIMLKDSGHFTDHGFHSDGAFDPLSEQLFFQGGSKWKKLRAKLTPAFTSGKLKAMLPIVAKNGKILHSFIEKNLEEGKNVFELRDLIARLNTNIITSVAFGNEVDTINDPNHVMRRTGQTVFEPSFMAGFRFFAAMFLPKINSWFKFKFVNDEIEDFFMSIIKDNVTYREQSGYQRNDLLQTLIQLKNDGFMSATKEEAENNLDKINLNDICAQSFGFYLGGFETTSATVSYCLHELAKNQSLQRRAQNEVDKLFKMSDDIVEMYDIIKGLKFLECCMLETLRKYPPLPLLNRQCNQDYQIANSGLIIPKGTPLIIPTFGLHRDPDIYENPLDFNPDRFKDNPSGSNVDGSYFLPFGEGVRVCIGHRMGKQNTKFQLALLLSKFNFELTNRKEDEICFNPNQLFLQPIGNIHLKLSLRNK